MTSYAARLMVLVVVAIAAGVGHGAAARPTKGEERAAPDRELAALTTEQLIDRLQRETEPGIGTVSTFWGSNFLPLGEEAQFQGGLLGSAPPHRSGTMTELVRRGVSALPALLAHLSDARPTQITVGPGALGCWFADEYDGRSRDARRQPKNVNRIGSDASILEHNFDSYTLGVGDLCYVAVGQIVNRGLNAVRYQPTACVVVNSPVKMPALAEATRRDWDRLTAKAHERELRADTLSHDSPWSEWDGLSRLLYYYPKAGRELAMKLLARPLFDGRATWSFVDERLLEVRPEHRAKLLKEYRRTRGEVAYRGLQWELLKEADFPDEQLLEDGLRMRTLVREILARYFRQADIHAVGLFDAADVWDQQRLIEHLSSYAWPGLDDAVYRVYRRAVRDPASPMSARASMDELALACAQHLAGKGRDVELHEAFRHRLEGVRRDLERAEEEDTWLPPGELAQSRELRDRVRRYDEFLRRLGAGH